MTGTAKLIGREAVRQGTGVIGEAGLSPLLTAPKKTTSSPQPREVSLMGDDNSQSLAFTASALPAVIRHGVHTPRRNNRVNCPDSAVQRTNRNAGEAIRKAES